MALRRGGRVDLQVLLMEIPKGIFT